jgi:hypothetical protein
VISVVTYGRNDNYGYNLAKRTAIGFNCLAEVLTGEDEILFVDYNTADHLPTLPEFIWDTLTEKALSLIRVIRISRDLHDQIKADSPLPILENVSRNAAIVRSNPKNHWILSTNPDVLLVLASPWPALTELLQCVPDSFYEMPRFDIPESVWSSFYRAEPRASMALARDWLVSHGAAVAETARDWRFQKYILFDAPGDFQLAPRDYFFRLRGFDESMNKYLHSDSNLAKRMWLLNNGRTDHLLTKLWVVHQDHYLTGEWAKNFGSIVHNDLFKKVFHEKEIEANDEKWGLQGTDLPMFSLAEKIRQERAALPRLSPELNGHLPLSKDVNWDVQPVHRLSHYDPQVLTLYVGENLRVMSPGSLVAYVGRNSETLQSVRKMWQLISPSGTPVYDLSEIAGRGESIAPDLLLVDFFYDRSDYWERRVRLLQESAKRRSEKKQITEYIAGEELSRFTESTDSREWESQIVPFWEKLLPHLRLRPRASIILLGCSQYVNLYSKFKEAFSKCYQKSASDPRVPKETQSLYERLKRRRNWSPFTTHENLMGPAYFGGKARYKRLVNGAMDVQTLYVHHRLVVLRVN